MKHFIKKTMMAIAAIVMCISFAATNVTAVSPGTKSDYNENEQSEIVFVQAGFYPHEEAIYSQPPELYEGIFIESSGNVRKFSFQNEKNVLTFGTLTFSGYPETIRLNDTSPQKNLLSKLGNINDFEVIGYVSQQELSYYTSALSGVNTNAEMKLNYSTADVLHKYTETFGVRNDNEIVFLNGSGVFSFIHTDENALEIDNWLRNLDISSDNPNIETTQPNPTENTTTTTVTTTEVKPNTEQTTKPPTEVPKIEFCQVKFILDYEEYYGIFLDSNRNVYSFAIDNVTENWNLYGAYSDIPIKLTDSMPQDGLLTYLYDHFDEWKFIGKTSEDDYADYKNELNQIDLNTEMAYRLYAEPDVVGLSHTETFAVRYDDNGNRQIVFLSGGLSIQHYLKNPDEHAIALNSKMIKYEEISDPVTTPNEITDQTTTAPTTPGAITTVTTTEAAPNTEPIKNENEQSEIAFCIVNSEQTGRMSYSYAGYFIESNGNVRHFSFEDIEDEWTLIFGEDYFNTDGTIKLDAAMPHEKLLSILSGNISAYKIIGNISEEEYASKASLLSEVDTSAEVTFKGFEYVGFPTYNESFGVRYDNDDNAQIVFMNGHVNGDMKYRTYLENPDEKSIELNKWLIEKCMSFVSPEPITTTAPVTTDVTTTTTVTTTTVPVATPEKGDANGNGKIDIRDAAFIAILCAKGQYEDIPEWADYNGDGKRNIRDAAFLAIDLAKGKIKA